MNTMEILGVMFCLACAGLAIWGVCYVAYDFMTILSDLRQDVAGLKFDRDCQEKCNRVIADRLDGLENNK